MSVLVPRFCSVEGRLTPGRQYLDKAPFPVSQGLAAFCQMVNACGGAAGGWTHDADVRGLEPRVDVSSEMWSIRGLRTCHLGEPARNRNAELRLSNPRETVR